MWCLEVVNFPIIISGATRSYWKHPTKLVVDYSRFSWSIMLAVLITSGHLLGSGIRSTPIHSTIHTFPAQWSWRGSGPLVSWCRLSPLLQRRIFRSCRASTATLLINHQPHGWPTYWTWAHLCPPYISYSLAFCLLPGVLTWRRYVDHMLQVANARACPGCTPSSTASIPAAPSGISPSSCLSSLTRLSGLVRVKPSRL